MTAREEEYHHAIEEGVKFRWLTNPTAVLGDESGWVKGLECQQMELGEPGPDGRRSPVAVEGSSFVLEINTMILSIGNSPNPLVPRTTPGLKTTRWGGVIADDDGLTSREGVYAGGDIVTGAATVILAAGAGKRAAAAIHEYLEGKKKS